MILITDHDTVTRFFRQKGAEIGRRVEYEYAGDVDNMHTGIAISKINGSNIHEITGRIIPSF